jgi:hypothetical protein
MPKGVSQVSAEHTPTDARELSEIEAVAAWTLALSDPTTRHARADEDAEFALGY